MRKILLILFLLPEIVFSQISINSVTGGFQTLGVGSLGPGTMVAGKLYVIVAGTSNDAGTVATISVSGTGQTWTEINSAGGVVNGGNRKRIQAFHFAPSSNNSNTISFSYTGTQDGGWVWLYEISGVDVGGTNGSNGILQSQIGSANSADPSLTFGGSVSSTSLILAAFINGVNPFTGTEESGYTESLDSGYATPDTGGYVMYRTNTTDTTPTVTAASGNWAGFIIEFKSANRRIIITN